MPEIDAFVVVPADEKIEFAVAVVIKPDRGVGVDPCGQSSLFRYARKVLAAVVVVKLGLAPLVQKKIFIAVVVVIPPDRAHGDTRARLVHIGKTYFGGDIFKFSVSQIAVERVFRALAA